MSNSNVAEVSAFNFGAVEVPVSTDFVKLGFYIMNVENCKYVKPEGVNQTGGPKTPYLEILFKGKLGQTQHKFYIGPKSGLMKQLQYLHFHIVGKECTKNFKNEDEVGKYYEMVFNDARITSKPHYMIIGGREDDKGNVWASLPYCRFIIPADMAKTNGFEEGPFEEGSANYRQYLEKQKPNISHTTNDMMLAPNPSQVPDNDSDLPF